MCFKCQIPAGMKIANAPASQTQNRAIPEDSEQYVKAKDLVLSAINILTQSGYIKEKADETIIRTEKEAEDIYNASPIAANPKDALIPSIIGELMTVAEELTELIERN